MAGSARTLDGSSGNKTDIQRAFSRIIDGDARTSARGRDFTTQAPGCCSSKVCIRKSYKSGLDTPRSRSLGHVLARASFIAARGGSQTDALQLRTPVTRATSAAFGIASIMFDPFQGVGPRRFFDLFSLALSSGYRLERKLGGKKSDWDPAESRPRVPLLPNSYITREAAAAAELEQKTVEHKGADK